MENTKNELIEFTFYDENLDRNRTYFLSEKQANFALQGVAKKDLHKTIVKFCQQNGIEEKLFNLQDFFTND